MRNFVDIASLYLRAYPTFASTDSPKGAFMRHIILAASILACATPAHATAFWTFNVIANASGTAQYFPPSGGSTTQQVTIPFDFNVTLPEFSSTSDLGMMVDRSRDVTGLSPVGSVFGDLTFDNGSITGTNFSYFGGPLTGGTGIPLYELRSQTFSVSFVSSSGGPGPVPEPATWTMMLTGFSILGWAMRRARQQTSLGYSFA